MNGSHHILIIDDSPEDRETYRRFVVSQDAPETFTIRSAQTGEEGLRLAYTDQPDCILLDFHLPDMTGLDWLQRLPRREGQLAFPVIMLTGQGNEAVAVQAMKHGAEDYLIKSALTPESLQVAVSGAITNAALNQSVREHRAHVHISQALAIAPSLAEVSSTLVEEIGTGLDWQVSVLWVIHAERMSLTCLGIWNRSPENSQDFAGHTASLHLPPGEDLGGKAWTSGQTIQVSHNQLLRESPRGKLALKIGLTNALAFPLFLRGQIVAVLEGWSCKELISNNRDSILPAIGQSITQFLEHKQIERVLLKREWEYRLVTNHIPALIASFDERQRFRLANRAYQEWFHQPEEAILGRHAKEVMGEKLYGQMCPYMEEVLCGKTVNFELLTQHTDGSDRWLNTTYVPDISEDQRIKGFYSLIHDMTHRKHTEERLRLQTQALARSNAELEQFAHIVSHDLQEPLRKIQTYSDRLRARCASLLGQQELEYVERMHKTTTRMQGLIGDLLTVSRLDSEKKPFQSIDLNQIVAEVVNDLETAISRLKATVDYSSLPRIDADPTQIHQLFQNLIGNALKFHKPNTTPHVRIFAQPDKPVVHFPSSPSLFCYIGVQDNGIGFDQQYADRIFGVFQRLHARDEYEGTGIGLSICRKVIERHHGGLAVNSIPGEGSTFWLALPFHQHAWSEMRSLSHPQESAPVDEARHEATPLIESLPL